MTENYLQIMTESLEKKKEVLASILELEKKQAALLVQPVLVDMEACEPSMEEKGQLIEQLNRLDEGFSSTYELVREAVQKEPGRYRELILQMQDLIRDIMDRCTQIEAMEKRNKASLDLTFAGKRKELKQQRISQAAAAKYYKAMNRINDVDPQLMDRKK